jgi:hypothetical protein
LGTNSMYSQRPPPVHHDTLAQGKKVIESNTFWKGWIQTAGKRQLLTAATTSYGVRFGCSSTWWKTYQAYFHMDLDSYPYLLGGGHNYWFTTETFFIYSAASSDFGPMDPVSSGAK